MTWRIAHIITGLQTGGAELMLERLLEHRSSTSFDPIVICLTGNGPTADRIRAGGVPVHCLSLRPGVPNPFGIRRIRNLLQQERIDVVQTWLYHADLMGGLAAKAAGIPVAWGIHHANLDPLYASRSVRLVARACAISGRWVPKRIVCCSEATRRAHAAFGYPTSKLVEIPNGFDTEAFHPDSAGRANMRKDCDLTSSDIVIGIIGRFVPLKNHRLFVEAAGRVADQNSSLRFVMIGDGLDHANRELADWIAETGHADRFRLLGRRADTAALLRGLDLYTLTSDTEAFPLVLGEAMSTGVPCIATNVGDAARIIGGTGQIVPAGDTEALASAIMEMTAPSFDWQAASAQARARIVDTFQIDATVARYDDLWQSLCRSDSS